VSDGIFNINKTLMKLLATNGPRQGENNNNRHRRAIMGARSPNAPIASMARRLVD
jgi:hypothetical protein